MTRAERERRLLVMLRAYVDESDAGTRGGIFTISGYVAFMPQWCDLTEEWTRVLETTPSVPYFRTASFRDKDWRDEHGVSCQDLDAKIAALESLLHESPHILFSSIFTLSKDLFRSIVGPEASHFTRIGRVGKTWLKTPYNYAFQHFVRFTLRKVAMLDISGDQVDFVFDHNDALFDDASALLRELRKTMEEPYRSMLGDAIPGDDKKLKPLQAADFLAARVKDCFTNTNDKTLLESLRFVAGKGDRNITVKTRLQDLERFANNLRRQRLGS
jgi:hypothetical protein